MDEVKDYAPGGTRVSGTCTCTCALLRSRLARGTLCGRGGGDAVEKLTRVGILEGSGGARERSIVHREQALVEVLGTRERGEVVGAREVVVAAHDGIAAAAAALQPGAILGAARARAVGRNVDGHVLVAAERRDDGRAVGECLRRGGSRRRVEALEEHHGAVLQDIVQGGRDGNLRDERDVRGQAVDLRGGVGLDIVIPVPRPGGEDLVGAEGSQARRRPGLGGTVAMAVEDVRANDRLGRGQRHGGEQQQQIGESHGSELGTGRARWSSQGVRTVTPKALLQSKGA